MSPRTPTQFKEIPEEKRTLIMDVALEHFAKEGYYNTPISHIAKHAGISKGLMYNYFESKEDLLTEIINRSMHSLAGYFDPDKDGHLSEEEFELFIRKLFALLRENPTFWRLFYQLLMQSEVRKLLINATISLMNPRQGDISNSGNFLLVISGMISDYFMRKKERKGDDYDAVLEGNMFMYTVEGFIMITAHMDEIDEVNYNKTIERIIELYK
jgi:AcrR family transcriptional regulator